MCTNTEEREQSKSIFTNRLFIYLIGLVLSIGFGYLVGSNKLNLQSIIDSTPPEK